MELLYSFENVVKSNLSQCRAQQAPQLTLFSADQADNEL
jgi:hypothetical protein